jgi:hypothetical protein
MNTELKNFCSKKNKKLYFFHYQNNLGEVKTKEFDFEHKMFTLLKSTPRLIGAKVEIKFLYFNTVESDIETTVYDQAVIEKISLRTEIKRIDITLSQCVIGVKRIPGVQHHSHVLAVERLRVIEEGHTDVNWEPEPTKTSTRQELIERLRTLSKSQKQNQSPSDDDDDDEWEIPTTSLTKQRLSARLKKDPTPDPSSSSPSPPTQRRYSYRVAQLENARPKVVAPTHATRSDLSPFSSSPEERRFSQRPASLAGARPKVAASHETKLHASPLSSPSQERRFSQRLASLTGARPKVVAPTPAANSRFRKPQTVHKFTKTFGSEQLNILPLSYRRHDQFTVKEGKLVEYKGHKSFSMEQLSIRAKHTQSRRHISPVACGMLNNEDGGIILMGVQDNGLIDGLMLSKAQQEHLVANIIDTFDRYRPKVPRHFYDINFIRVKLTNSKTKEDKAYLSDETNIPHLLRTTKLCWCDHRAMTSINLGFLHKCWLIELKIHPRDHTDPRTIKFVHSSTFYDDSRMFQSETGKAYYRIEDMTKRIA